MRRTALQTVLGSAEAKARDGATGVLEEDTRLTALFLWTLQSTETNNGGEEGDSDDEATTVNVTAKAPTFDMVRRFAQPMGVDFDRWTGRIISQSKGVVRLLPVTARTRALFGENGASAAAEWIESESGDGAQGSLFPEPELMLPSTTHFGGGRKRLLDINMEGQAIGATTLDRLHAAMLLQVSGHTHALRTLIAAEQDRGPDFLRLANALSALYPRGSQEKRLLDAMLLAVPR